tara:strand:- start:234 stop:488 length:255 start_codon:yes stop_codon:yes gene_type:complete
MTWEELKARANKVIVKLLDDHERAPVRGSYNRLLGKYTTDQRTVVKAATNQIKLINQIGQMLYQKDVVSFDDEEPKLPKMTIND